MREISRIGACFLLDELGPRGLRLWILQPAPARGRLLDVNAVRHHWCILVVVLMNAVKRMHVGEVVRSVLHVTSCCSLCRHLTFDDRSATP